MDTEARPIGNDIWLLTDLLGRKVGTIVQSVRGFVIEHDLPSILDGIILGPHKTLDAAMSAVEKQTSGQCRRAAP